MGYPWDRVRALFRTGSRNGSAAGEPAGDALLDELVWQARREVEAAQAYFENVSDPDLVDHACYLLEAAQKRYSYLLRLARQGRMAG